MPLDCSPILIIVDYFRITPTSGSVPTGKSLHESVSADVDLDPTVVVVLDVSIVAVDLDVTVVGL